MTGWISNVLTMREDALKQGEEGNKSNKKLQWFIKQKYKKLLKFRINFNVN